MLICVNVDEVSDTRDDDSSNEDGKKNKPNSIYLSKK